MIPENPRQVSHAFCGIVHFEFELSDVNFRLFPFSCFLLCMKDDSIEGIYDTLKHCALISKSAGGIGVAVSCIRATGSYIAGVSE